MMILITNRNQTTVGDIVIFAGVQYLVVQTKRAKEMIKLALEPIIEITNHDDWPKYVGDILEADEIG